MTREEAILLLHDMKDTYDEIHENTNYEIGYEQMTALDMAIEALSEPNTGKWVDCGMNADGTHNIKCDQCGAGFRTRGHANSHYTKERFKWCPSCGADMRGSRE